MNTDRMEKSVLLRAPLDRVWEVEKRRLEEARAYLADISAQWDRALERLRAHVEG